MAGVLGPFVSDLEADELRAIPVEAIPETVRQLGSAELKRIPKAQVKKRIRTVLEMLVSSSVVSVV